MRSTVAASWVALLATGLVSQQPLVRTGKTAVVTVHPGARDAELAARLADEALAVVERLRPLLDRWQLRVPKPLALHLHLDAKPFRALEKTLTPYPFVVEDVCRATGAGDAEAQVLLWPPVSSPILSKLGLPPATEAVLQRCAAQLVALQLAETARRDVWVAEVFAFGALDALRNPSGAYGVDPTYDARRGIHATWHEEGTATPLGTALANEQPPRVREDLALRQELATLAAQLFAATGAAWPRKLLAQPAKPLGVGATRAWIVESLLGKDAAKNELRFGRMVAALRPVFLFAGPGIGTRDGRIVLAAAVERSAWAEARRPPPGPFVVQSRVTIAGGHQAELRVDLAYEKGRSMIVALVTGQGCTTYLSVEGKPEYQRLQRAEIPLYVDRPFDLAIEVDTEVRVRIDGELVLTQRGEGPPPRAAWGIATNDSLLLLEGLRCGPLAASRK